MGDRDRPHCIPSPTAVQCRKEENYAIEERLSLGRRHRRQPV